MHAALHGNKSNSTVATSVVRGILHAAETMGVAPDKACSAASIDYAAVDRADRITGAQFVALWEAVTRLSKDPYCGLHIGEQTTASSAHIVGYLLMNCRTIGHAIERYLRYQQIVSNSLLEVRLNRTRTYSYLDLKILDPTLTYNRQLMEWVIAGEASLLRKLARKPIKPVKVWFAHPASSEKTHYQRLFQAPVLFDQGVNALILSNVDLAMPIGQADPKLLSIFERHAQEYLKSLNSTRYVDHVRRVLVSTIADGRRPNIDGVSAQLRIGTRSLQHKLAVEGVTYNEILRNIRRDLALRYLRDKTIPVSKIYYLLGFSEPSVFYRAFRKWTGQSPGSYRETIAHQLRHKRSDVHS